MSDDLEKLAALLKEEVPPPSSTAKSAALDAGMAAFEKNSENIQGSANAERPIHNRTTTGSGFLKGLKDMFEKLTPRGMMLGTASFATIALAIVITQNYDFGKPALPVATRNAIAPIDGTEDLTSNTPLKNSFAVSGNAGVDQGPQITGTVADDNAPRQNDTQTAEAFVAPQPELEEDNRARTEALVAPGSLADSVTAVAPNTLMLSAPQPSVGGLMSTSGEGAPYIEAEPQTRDQFDGEAVSPVKATLDEPVSTFSIDVDTASYSVMRRSLLNGYLPNPDSVRTEEMINYFDYNYTSPATTEQPFAPQATVMPTPWNEDTLLIHIGIQGYDIPLAERPPVNLVFLLDTSGSMNSPDKLPLLIQSFRLLLGELSEQDSVAIVTYAGSAGMALEPTPANETRKILDSLTRLSADGSTAGQAGLEQAYALAEDMLEDGETSRVILATDGDFNVGMSSTEAMKTYIEDKRESGVYLSILGFGQGNYNDALMQTLAQNGNGTAAYIDTLAEAQKVLVDQIGGALFTIAQDVKIQVEFNPAEVAEYRLIGYETRALNREDFNNDAVDAGDIGAGTQVTALYEITPVGSAAISIDPLRYSDAEPLPEGNGELAFLKLRYKLPGESTSNLIATPVNEATQPALSEDVIFSTAVASFGQLLRGDTRMGDWSFEDVLEMAQRGKGDDPFGYRAEFMRLVRLAETAQ